MAYVAPTTVSTGCLISAASWNQNVVNNILQIVASPLTVDFVNDRVGINVAAPIYGAEIKANLNSNVALRVSGNTAGNNSTQIRYLGASSNQELYAVGTDVGTGTGQKVFDIYDLVNSKTQFHITASGAFVMGSGTCNVNNTQGLTIQQGNNTAVDEGFSMKTNTVNHGMTGISETDSYFIIGTVGASFGGAQVQCFSASSVTSAWALLSIANCGKAADTTKSNAAKGIYHVRSTVKNGTGTTLAASTGNIMVFDNAGSSRFIFQGGGDLFADSGLSASAFDTQDDVQLVRALEVERNPGSVVRDHFDAWLKYNRKDLEDANIAAFNDPAEGGDGSVFVNVMGLQRLHSGALWQLHKRIQPLEERNRALESRLLQLEHLLSPPAKDTA